MLLYVSTPLPYKTTIQIASLSFNNSDAISQIFLYHRNKAILKWVDDLIIFSYLRLEILPFNHSYNVIANNLRHRHEVSPVLWLGCGKKQFIHSFIWVIQVDGFVIVGVDSVVIVGYRTELVYGFVQSLDVKL